MPTDAAHDLAHLDRVWATAREIAQHEADVDADVLQAASYLHDLVNLAKDHPDRRQASRLCADAAVPHLTALGFDADHGER